MAAQKEINTRATYSTGDGIRLKFTPLITSFQYNLAKKQGNVFE